MKIVLVLALLALKATAMRNIAGPAMNMVGGAKQPSAAANKPAKNQFPSEKIDTATGIFQKYARKDLLDSIENTLIHLDDKLTAIQTRFEKKLKAVQILASVKVAKVLDGIRMETQKLELL